MPGSAAMDSFRRFRQSRWWALLLRPLLSLVLSSLVARVLVSLVGSVDWQQVATALGQLEWAQAPRAPRPAALRQAFNSVPLRGLRPRTGVRRGFQNDLTANLVGTVSPPPTTSSSGSRCRPAVSRQPTACRASPSTASPSTSSASASHPGRRGGGGQDLSGDQVWSAVLSLVDAAVIVVALILVARGERFARMIGRRAALIAARFREDADDRAWAVAVTGFRARMSNRLVRGLPPSLAALAEVVRHRRRHRAALPPPRRRGRDAAAVAIVLGSFFDHLPHRAAPGPPGGARRRPRRRLHRDSGVAAEREIVAAWSCGALVALLGTLLLGALRSTGGAWRTRAGTLPSADVPAEDRT